jgi:hypothetical protein
LPGGGGGVDDGPEVIEGGDGIDEELLQLCLLLLLCRHLGLPAAALRDQLEDAGESLVGDEFLQANPRARGTRRRGGGVASTSMLTWDTREEDVPDTEDDLDAPAS